MKLTWLKWGAVPLAVLVSAARAIDRRRNGQSGEERSGHQQRNPRGSRSERRKTDQCGKGSGKSPAEPDVQTDLHRQAQRQHGALRQQQGWPTPRKPAGPHRPGHQERTAHRRRNGQAGKTTARHQQASRHGPQGQWRHADGQREKASQQGAEPSLEEYLPEEAQRQDAARRNTQAVVSVCSRQVTVQERRSPTKAPFLLRFRRSYAFVRLRSLRARPSSAVISQISEGKRPET